jgi:hypothetical protein
MQQEYKFIATVTLAARSQIRDSVLIGRKDCCFGGGSGSNCVVEMRGGEQPEAKDQSINKNVELDSASCIGESAS